MIALLSTRDYVYGALIALLIGGGLWYHHKVLAEGIADQVARDSAARIKLEAETKQQTADLQARATIAEQSYDKERNANLAFIDSHPIQPLRLCNANDSGGVMPKAGAIKLGDASASPHSGIVQSMPTRDSSRGQESTGPDISGLLSALGAAADNVSAELREFQTR